MIFISCKFFMSNASTNFCLTAARLMLVLHHDAMFHENATLVAEMRKASKISLQKGSFFKIHSWLNSTLLCLKHSYFFNYRWNFWRLSYLCDTYLSSRKMFHLLLKKMFVFNTTLNLFGAETGVTEIWQASKIWPYAVQYNPRCLIIYLWMYWNVLAKGSIKIAKEF